MRFSRFSLDVLTVVYVLDYERVALHIAILFENRTWCILMQLRKIKFLVIGKELKQPLDNSKRFAQTPKLSQKVFGL